MKALLAIVLVAASICVNAAEKTAVVVRNFEAKELNTDVFGVMSRPDISGAPQWGAGIGASYFITRGLGAGVRAMSYDTSGVFVDELETRILFRVPLWDRLAPYGFVSGMYSFENHCAGAGAGGGLEYRFNKHLALFGETGLRVWTNCDDTSSISVNECGVRTTATKDAPGCDWLTTFGIRVALGFK